MSEQIDARTLLESIHKKPPMYWGNSDHPFTSLVAFLSGYGGGFYRAQSASGIRQEDQIHPDLVPSDFHEFVAGYFGHTGSIGARGWQLFIQENTKTEKESFDLFFKLRREYDRVKGI